MVSFNNLLTAIVEVLCFQILWEVSIILDLSIDSPVFVDSTKRFFKLNHFNFCIPSLWFKNFKIFSHFQVLILNFLTFFKSKSLSKIFIIIKYQNFKISFVFLKFFFTFTQKPENCFSLTFRLKFLMIKNRFWWLLMLFQYK